MTNQRRFALIGRGFGSSSFDEAVTDLIGGILVDSSEINFTYTDATPSITAALIDASIAFARLQNFDAVSVLGRAANSSGVSDEIAASANDQLLRRTSDTLNFGQLTAGMFPNTVVPDAALSNNVPLLNLANVFTSNIQTLQAAVPEWRITNTTAGSGLKTWSIQAEADGDFSIFTRNDALAAVENALVFSRNSSSEVTAVTLLGDVISFSGEFRLGNAVSALVTNIAFPAFYSASGSGAGDFANAGTLFIQPRSSAARDIILLTGSTSPSERLRIAGSNGLITISNSAGFTIGGTGETLATFTDDGAVTLYFDNTARFATTSTGISVVGDIATATTLTISGTGETLATFADDGAVTLYFNNVIALATTAAGIDVGVGATINLRTDADATSGNTRLLIYDVDNATLERVSVGAADSGGTGFKVLRIPN